MGPLGFVPAAATITPSCLLTLLPGAASRATDPGPRSPPPAPAEPPQTLKHGDSTAVAGPLPLLTTRSGQQGQVVEGFGPKPRELGATVEGHGEQQRNAWAFWLRTSLWRPHGGEREETLDPEGAGRSLCFPEQLLDLSVHWGWLVGREPAPLAERAGPAPRPGPPA